jgi:histidyl-tRNA synthetase
MKATVQPVKGTRDFYPEIMAVRSWLYASMRKVSESFGYQEYDGPFLESIELYGIKSGDELVKEQSFVFQDRGGNLVTLRPELTPSLVRMVAQRQNQLSFPLRWWSFGPFWRYERPQKGRTREFFQWNVDLFGINTPTADAELVAVVATFFHQIGLQPSEALILVNSRHLMEAELTGLGIPKDNLTDIFRLIDRQDKMRREDWLAYAKDTGLSNTQIDGLEAILSEQQLWEKSDDLVQFFSAVEALGVGEYVRFSPTIIRGLDYYTGIVFEALAQRGDLHRSILGGGRYNNLLSDVGGNPLPATGFAMGDLVISLLLDELGLIPKGVRQSPAPVYVSVFDQELLSASLTLSAELREAGLNVVCHSLADKLSKQLKYADRNGFRVAVVLGPDELAEGRVTLKSLTSGDQLSVSRVEVATVIRQLLDQGSAS